MKCTICGKEMVNTKGGCYHCPDCHTGVDDLVYRHYASETQQVPQGWQCPKCGAILAPHQNYCPFCSGRGGTLTTTCVTNPSQKVDTNTTIKAVL